MNTQEFIKWREIHKEKIRGSLMIICAILIVYFFHFQLQPALKQINDEYNEEVINKLNLLNKGDIAPYVETETLFNISNSQFNNNNEIRIGQTLQVEHSPVVKAFWAIINIIILFWVEGLLWRKKEE